jgi:hypothetical protein
VAEAVWNVTAPVRLRHLVSSRPRDARADIACFALVLAAMAGLDNYVKRWRTALHVTVSALIVAILGLAITPSIPSRILILPGRQMEPPLLQRSRASPETTKRSSCVSGWVKF